MTNKSSKWIKTHHACSKCESSDAASTNSNNYVTCFSCGAHYPADESSNNHSRSLIKSLRFEIPMTNSRPLTSLPTGEVQAIPDRKITEETCRKYGYKVATDGAKHLAEYRTQSGQHVATHIRYLNPKGCGASLFSAHALDHLCHCSNATQQAADTATHVRASAAINGSDQVVVDISLLSAAEPSQKNRWGKVEFNM